MKTPLTELIDLLKKYADSLEREKEYSALHVVKIILVEAEMKLTDEKKAIEDAYGHGLNHGYIRGNYKETLIVIPLISKEQYFAETFKQE